MPFMIYVKNGRLILAVIAVSKLLVIRLQRQAYPDKNFFSYSIVSAEGLFFVGGISHNGPAIKCRLCWFGHGGCEQKC